MRTITVLSLLVFGMLRSGLSEASPALGEGLSSWPGFRGQGNSITLDEKLPLKWSEQEGVAWRAPLEGFGQSSPVTWGKQVYVTSTGGESKEHLFLECFHLISGKRLWRLIKDYTAHFKQLAPLVLRRRCGVGLLCYATVCSAVLVIPGASSSSLHHYC